MAGTLIGGKAAAAKNLEKDPDFYRKIGSKGGKNSRTGGFAQGEVGRQRARKYGAIGGRISRRRPVVPKPQKSNVDTLIADVRKYRA